MSIAAHEQLAPSGEFVRPLNSPARRSRTLVSVVRNVASYAIGSGLSMDEISRATRLKRSHLLDDTNRLADEIPSHIWRMIVRHSDRPAPTLHMASGTDASLFGPWLRGAQFAPTLEEALRSMIRFSSVLADEFRLRLLSEGRNEVLESWHPKDALDGGWMAEMGVATLVHTLRETFGFGDCVRRIEFAHVLNGPPEAYTRHFGIPVLGSAGRTAIVFRRDALRSSSRRGDRVLMRYGETELETLQDRLALAGDRQPLARVYESVARNAQRSEFGAQELARSLHTSLRALQRLTSEHGVTVRGLLEEAREMKARNLLVETTRSVDDIAHALRYSDARSFRRAFRRWTGQSPADFRRGTR
ncbi:MAG: AraC family transcriptional regulator ligand-binding domain-containing protein [Planctomycetota bacterium]